MFYYNFGLNSCAAVVNAAHSGFAPSFERKLSGRITVAVSVQLEPRREKKVLVNRKAFWFQDVS